MLALRYPDNGRILVRSLADSTDQDHPDFHCLIRDVRVLGFTEKPEWHTSEVGLAIETKSVKSEYPVVFEIKIS